MILNRKLFFGLGLYGGLYINQQYHIPQLPSPREVFQRVKDLVEKYQQTGPSSEVPPRVSDLVKNPIMKEAIEKLEDLEKQKRKSAPSQDS